MTGPSRTALITGASSGIGASFARRLARDGYNLILHGRREPLLQKLCQELQAQYTIKAENLLAELSDPEETRRVEDRIRGTADLEILVNNAGYSTLRAFHDEDIDGQLALIRVHIDASVRLAHAAIPGMIRRGKGNIINVASVAAFTPAPGSLTYCATKSYLVSFSESLHLELKDHGIRVQAFCPGFTTTDFHSRLGVDTSGRAFRHFMTAEKVVDVSIKGLKRGKVICVPGLQNKFAVLAVRLFPRRLYYGLVRLAVKLNPARRGVLEESS
jgi:short-subunit dehydrogenase